MSHRGIGIILISLGAFVIGYFTNILVELENLNFSKDIDPLNVVSLVLSFILVVYISILFEQVKERSRLKKEIVLSKADQLINEIENLSKNINRNNLPVSEVPPALKQLSLEFYSANNLIELAGYSNKEFSKTFLKAYRDLRNLVSLTSAKRAESNDIHVDHGKFKYSSIRLSAIQKSFISLRNIATEEQLRIVDL